MGSVLKKIVHCERGESGIGLIIAVLVIGSLIAILSAMQSCFFEGKEAKKHRRVLSKNEQSQKNMQVHRAPTGYQVKY